MDNLVFNEQLFIFPIFGGRCTETDDKTEWEMLNVYGTAFSVGGGYFVTAGHVLGNAVSNETASIGWARDSGWYDTPIIEHEVIAEYDIGYFTADLSGSESFQWNFAELLKLQDVQTCGFPLSFDRERKLINPRAFKGYVVSQVSHPNLASRPRCYELSFACPSGLSGAPLLSDCPPQVRGIILGNRTTEVEVSWTQEAEREGQKELSVHRSEMLNWGLAVQSDALANIQSRLLGGSLIDYFKRTNLAA